MSIFNRPSAAEVFRRFTHQGWLGFCPVWLNQRSGHVTERNWIPEWWMSLNILVLDGVALVRHLLGFPEWEGWPILETGRIGPGVTR